MTYYADSKAVAADLKRRGVTGVSLGDETENAPEASPPEMTAVRDKDELYFHHTRPSERGLKFAATAQEAADLLLGGQSVRMVYDIGVGRKVKQIVMNREGAE